MQSFFKTTLITNHFRACEQNNCMFVFILAEFWEGTVAFLKNKQCLRGERREADSFPAMTAMPGKSIQNSLFTQSECGYRWKAAPNKQQIKNDPPKQLCRPVHFINLSRKYLSNIHVKITSKIKICILEEKKEKIFLHRNARNHNPSLFIWRHKIQAGKEHNNAYFRRSRIWVFLKQITWISTISIIIIIT